MSPHIQTLLSEAADDGGRSPQLDLGAIRSAGRRATWLRRATIGAGGLGTAAVVTSIALLIGTGGASPVAPGDGGPSRPTNTVLSPETANLKPLIDALEAKGYVVASAAGVGTSGGEAPASGATASPLTTSARAEVLSVRDGSRMGVVVAAEFTDLATLLSLGDVGPAGGSGAESQAAPTTNGCAALPGIQPPVDWAPCTREVSDSTSEMWSTAGDGAAAVTLVRPDGTGVSVAVSSRPMAPGTDALDSLPLTANELYDIVAELAATNPLFPPVDQGDAPTPVCSGGDLRFCQSSSDHEIDISPLTAALEGRGFAIAGGGSSGGGFQLGPDSPVSGYSTTSVDVTSNSGGTGSAAVGVFGSAGIVGAVDDAYPSTCAVSPLPDTKLDWRQAEDTSRPCVAAGDLAVGVPNLLRTADGGAIAATVLRADGTVVSVAVSLRSTSGGAPLAELPLTGDQLVALLSQLG